MKNSEEPIYPSTWTKCDYDSYEPAKPGRTTGYEKQMGGLTKREYAAIKFAQAFLSRENPLGFNILEESVVLADKLFEELEKNKNEKDN